MIDAAYPATLMSKSTLSMRSVCILIALVLSAAVFLAPGVPFIIDGGIYLDMAHSLARDHSLAIGGNGGVDGAPPLTKFLTIAHNGQVMPQYPSGYAFLAAPFYVLFGVKGLMLMNALSFALCIWLTYLLTSRFYTEQTAWLTAGVFAIATFAPTYMLAIWPHMIALAFWLGAIYYAVAADQTENRDRSHLLFALSGLLIGAGLNVRVDIFLSGMIIFFWLRLFARPHDRTAPLWVLLGMAPGLLAAAVLNELKFGVFSPLSYGKTGGLASFGPYLSIAIAGGGAFIAAWVLNIPALRQQIFSKSRWRYVAAASVATAALIMLIPPLRDLVLKMLAGVYVLVINLQAHDAYHQDGVERNAYGHLLFWGYPKKALVQSIPWLALIIIPVIHALRGRNSTAAGLCVLGIAAPVCFYALNQWHGGGSYNMRYFMPALPFLAILAANGFQKLRGDQSLNRQSILIALVAATVFYLGLQEIGQTMERYYAPAALYPQWLIATVLAGLCVWFLVSKSALSRKACLSVAMFAFAYAVAISLYEEAGHERTRAEQSARADEISAPLSSGSLVITPMQTSLIPAERRGVFVMAAAENTAAQAGAAAEAFSRAGRCVYFHNTLAASIVRDYLAAPIDPAPLWALSKRFSDDPRFAFFTFANAPTECRF